MWIKSTEKTDIWNVVKSVMFLTLSLILTFGLMTGCEGPAGAEGPQGPQGPEGPEGPVGPAGEDGSTMHSGTGAPGSDIGENGDYYLDTNTGELYGPKDSSGWGSPIIVLKGEDGQDGQDGEDGSQIFSGTGAPASSLGVEGDYYLDESSYELYGPKTSSGWGTPLNLKGADGNANVTLYIFTAPDFTSTNPQHTVSISGLTVTEIFESQWNLYFNRGAILQFIPGVIDFGSPRSEFTVEMIYNNSTGDAEFRIELINGSDYFPDEIYIYRTQSTNVIDNTSSMNKSSDELISSEESSPKQIINRVGLNNVNVVDK